MTLACAQTGSGKTFSIMGIPQDPGVVSLVGAEMFEKIERINEQARARDLHA